MRTNMSAPRPVIPGSTSPCTAHVAIAASTALPPALRIRIPASAASGRPAATLPRRATLVGAPPPPPPVARAGGGPPPAARRLRIVLSLRPKQRRQHDQDDGEYLFATHDI